MATPTAICPVCFVRFPVVTASSTPTACPACAHRFAAPVADDEPVTAEVAGEAEDDLRAKPRREPKAAQARRAKAVRTGFRATAAGRGADDREPSSFSPLVVLGLVFGAASLLSVLVVLVVVAVSPPGQSEELAALPPPPTEPPLREPDRPNPEPFRPNPNPEPNPWPNPNPEPVRPPIGRPVGPEARPLPGPVEPVEFPNIPPPKPKEKLKLPAVTPVAMKPAPLTDDGVEVNLPGAVADACVGGGGRYYCLYIPDKKQVAVFDVCEAKVAKYLPVAGGGAKVAAGMNKLLVLYPDDNLVTRFDLTTFAKEATVKLPFDGKVKAVAMGSASAGPLLIQHQAGNGALDSAPVSYLDPVRLTPFDLPDAAGGRGHASVRDAMHFRASPDGTVFGVWATSHSPTGLGSTVLTDGQAKSHYEHDSVGHVVPGPDGTLHTLAGRYTPTLKKKGDKGRGQFCLPAASGNLYFTLTAEGADAGPGGFPGRFPGQAGETKQKADIKMDGDDRSLVTLKGLPGAPTDAWTAGDFTADKRYLLVPDAKAFVALAHTNDKLVVRRFDVLASLEASGVDYLFVNSRPAGVKPGEPYEYQIETKSRKGGVTYTLDAGPDGLKVSPAGRVTWAVPKGYAGGDTVIVTVSDRTGQQVFHTFELKERPAEPAAGPRPPAAAEPPPVAVDPPKPPREPAVVPGPGPKGSKVEPDSIVLAPAKPFDVPKTAVTEKTAVALPDAADAVCLGGGGRFVILRLPKSKQLAVLDLCQGKVAKYLPLAEAAAPFAAGMSKVFVYHPSADVYQRWSLETFEKEVTVKNPVGGRPKQLLMGHSTDGPLATVGGGERVPGGGDALAFLNPTTFKAVEVTTEQGRGFGRGGFDAGSVVRVSGDGRVYGWHRTHVSPQGFNSIVLAGKTATSYNDHTTPWHVAPGADGTLFAGIGIYTPEHKPVGDKLVHGGYPNPVSVPATAAPWYVRVTFGDQPGRDKGKSEVAVALTTDPQVSLPLADHDGFQFPTAMVHPAHLGQGKPFHLLDRVVLNPRAGVLAIVNEAGDKVHLHPLDLKAQLAKSGRDFLLVMSKPPAAVKGQKWTYTPDVWSKTGKVAIKVETGPPGLTAAGGTVTWAVPADFPDAEAEVILTVTDGGKQETFHTFALPVGRAK